MKKFRHEQVALAGKALSRSTFLNPLERKPIVEERNMGRKSAVPSDIRVDAVLSLLRKQEKATQIAQRTGVSEQTLYRWRDEFIAGGRAQLEGKSGDSPAAREVATMRREITMRDQVIGELTIANRNLEKLSGPTSALHARSLQGQRTRHDVNGHERQILTQRR